MTTLEEAARKALEALETCSYGDYSAKHVVDPSFDGDAVEAAIESLKAALAQQGEPTHYLDDHGWLHTAERAKFLGFDMTKLTPLYTAAPAPQAQQRMTDEQIEDLVKQCGGKWNGDVWTFEDADLHPFVRTALQPAQPAAQPLTDGEVCKAFGDPVRVAFDQYLSKSQDVQPAWQTATQVLEAREEAGKRLNARLREAMDAMPIAQPVAQYDKTEMNAFVQDLYNKLARKGKHGHYETLFHCVHKAIERANGIREVK